MSSKKTGGPPPYSQLNNQTYYTDLNHDSDIVLKNNNQVNDAELNNDYYISPNSNSTYHHKSNPKGKSKKRCWGIFFVFGVLILGLILIFVLIGTNEKYHWINEGSDRDVDRDDGRFEAMDDY